MRRIAQGLALVGALGLGAFGGIEYSDRTVPNLSVLGNAAYAFREPGWRNIYLTGDSTGVYKAFVDAVGDTSVMAIWKKRTLALRPYPTHSLRITHPDSFRVNAVGDTLYAVDEWVMRDPLFPRFNRPGHLIQIFHAEGDSHLVLLQRVNVGEYCPDSHSTSFEGTDHIR